MPTYLTPGVYVEEVTSGKKPIEGVGTAVAAFVGLAPGGPVTIPMRIANWSQFVRIYGDTTHPDNGPFMEGAYLAHAVYGYFQNGGTLCWVVRVGVDENGKVSARRPAGGHRSQCRGSARGGAGRRQCTGGRRDQRGGVTAGGGPDVQGRGEFRWGARGVLRCDLAQGPDARRHQGERRIEADQDRGHRGRAARSEAGRRQVRTAGSLGRAVRGQAG